MTDDPWLAIGLIDKEVCGDLAVPFAPGDSCTLPGTEIVLVQAIRTG